MEEEIKAGYTRVTQIIGWFEAIQLSKIGKDVLHNAGLRGSRVHQQIEDYFDNSSQTGDLNSYFGSFLQWYSGLKNPLLVVKESRLYCDVLKITGKFDGLMRLEGYDKAVLVDWKTSSIASPRTWKLQGAYYQYLCERNKIDIDPTMIFIQLDKFGSAPRTHIFVYDRKLKDLVISTYNVYNHFCGDTNSS